MLEVNNFTAIAKRIIPKTFLIMLMPDLPNQFPNSLENFKIAYTKMILIKMARIILDKLYSALKESKEVIVPGPAIIGNARGTIEAVSGASSLYNVIPNIISSAKNNITNEPATVNEFISIPIRLSISLPKKRNPIIIKAAIIEAFSD